MSATPPTSVVKEAGNFTPSNWGDRIFDVWSGIAPDLMSVRGIDGEGAREAVSDRLYDEYGDSWRNLTHSTREELLRTYLSDDEVEAAQPMAADNSYDFEDEVTFNDNYESEEDIDTRAAQQDDENAARMPESNDEAQYCPNCGEVFDSSKTECRNCNSALKPFVSESISRKKKVTESVCNNCTADGVIPCQVCNGHAGNDKCSECKGTGEMNCPECNGQGYITDKKMKKIKEAYREDDEFEEGADDYCEGCFKRVANHECDEGLLCDVCYHDIYGDRDPLDECQYCEPEESSVNITTSYDSKTSRKSITITADNDKAEELARIIELSGLNSSAPISQAEPKEILMEPDTEMNMSESKFDSNEDFEDVCQNCGKVIHNDRYNGLCSKCYDKKHTLDEAKSYSIQARKTKTSPVTYLSLTPTKWVTSKEKAFKFDDRESAVTKATAIKGKNEVVDVKVVPNLNESKLNEFHARGHECDFCGNPLSQDDYIASGKWSYKCGSCGFKYNHGGETPEAQIRAQLKSGKIDQGDSYSYLDESAEPKRIKHPGVRCSAADCKKTARWRMKDGKMMCDNCKTANDKKVDESLTPSRKSTGLNGAPKAWANEPNEQIAHWRAVCDDTQGLSQSHDMFPNRIGDNPLKVAVNKIDKPLHENAKVNAIAENLAGKFKTLDEGLGKEIKRGLAGWDPELDATPKSVISRVRKMTIPELKKMLANPDTTAKHSPAGLQQKAIRQELKRRGVNETVINENEEQTLREKLSALKKRYNMAVSAKAPNRHAIKAEIERVKNKLADSVPSESLTENDAKYTANQLNFKHLESKLANFGYTHSPEEEESGNHSSHVFTRGDGDFITVSKDGKFDWAINDEFGFSKEGTGRTALLQTLTFQKGNPMDSLDTFPEVDSTELSHEDLDDLLDVPAKKKFNACSRCSGTGKVAGLTCSECFGEGTGKWGDEYYD
jgi:ribosomal protein L37AE/L43A